jgi:DNA-binding IclR family transcriptional regulator
MSDKRWEITEQRAKRGLRCLESDEFLDIVLPALEQMVEDLRTDVCKSVIEGDSHRATVAAAEIAGVYRVIYLHDEFLRKSKKNEEEQVTGLDSLPHL